MVRATDAYVRVIVRRPHAYWFLQSHLPELDRSSRSSASLSGPVTLPDGTSVDGSKVISIDASKLPLPGLVVLDVEGGVLGRISFLASGTREDMLEFLREHAP